MILMCVDEMASEVRGSEDSFDCSMQRSETVPNIDIHIMIADAWITSYLSAKRA